MPNTYYIATDGSDTNDGSEATPFATFAAAANLLVAGDTVLFQTGTYQNATYGDLTAEGVRDIWKDSADTIIRLNDVHGTSVAPITIKPVPGAQVKLQYDGNGAIVLRNSSHIVIEGFEIEGPATSLSLQDAQDAQWTYRIATSEDAEGEPVYEYFERDPSEVLTTKISDTIASYAALDIDQSGSGKPNMFNAPAISLPLGSHHITITGNTIHDSAAHAVSGHGGNDYVTVSHNEIYNNNRHTSNGTHAISFKGLDSLDDVDEPKIIIENNYLYDNFNALVSWVTTKTAVKMEIDEGKSIHIQNATAEVDAQTGHQWDHGQILIANNLIERAGNAGVTVNEARGVTIVNNTIIDAGYINTLLVQDNVAGSDWEGFFSQQGLVSGETTSVGALRLAGGDEGVISDNLIVLSDNTVFAVDAADTITNDNTVAQNNLIISDRGLRIRSESETPGDLSDGFQQIEEAGFVNAAAGDFRLLSTSVAVNAGSETPKVATDYDGSARSDAAADVGAFEYLAPVAGMDRTDRTGIVIDTGNAEVDALVDGLLMSSIYTSGAQMTYSFDLTLALRDTPGFAEVRDSFEARIKTVLDHVHDLTGLTFIEVDAAKQAADLYFSARPDVASAYVAGHQGGINHVFNISASDPQLGGYTDHLILHEMGHGLGLAHGHDEGALPAAFQGHSWSLMSYRPHPDTTTEGYVTNHGPETFMLADIAALQYQFGAGFDAQSGDTTYTVDPVTGEFFIDGVGQGVPVNNSLQRAIWDGNGIDTLDLSNATDALSIDLRPGAFTDLGEAHRIRQSQDADGMTLYAPGNLANPYLYQGDTRSLLENAIGGTHDDTIIGNQTGNTLTGGYGRDNISGQEGNDHLSGGSGDDTLNGDDGHDFLNGGGGSDHLGGGAGNDRLFGSNGNDTLTGGAGKDVLDGGTGADVMRGGLGNDTYIVDVAADQIIGEIGYSAGGGIDTVRSFIDYVQPDNIEIVRLGNLSDTTPLSAIGTDAPGTLVGNAGRNVLTGKGGNDQINGNYGDDILIGGVGRDTLVGGSGADTFVYNTIADSRAGAQTRDFINGFSHTHDRIDLSAIDANTRNSTGDDAFHFIGKAQFDGTGYSSAGQLRTQGLGPVNAVLLEGDHDGDGVADFQIIINQTTWMTYTDFVL